MEETLKSIATYLSRGIEMLAAIVIGIGTIQFMWQFVPVIFKRGQYVKITWLRVRFGSYLIISLELLLAADILLTAVAPSWEDIGKLGAIAAIRTLLNFFLTKELREVEKRLPEEQHKHIHH